MKPIHHAALVLASSLLACDPGPAPADSAADPGATQSSSQELRSHVQVRNNHEGQHRGVSFTRTDLTSDQDGAKNFDPTLVNAWGLAFNPAGVAWISANGNGISEIYNAQGGILAPPITVPPPMGSTDTAAPTGQIFNDDPIAFGGDLFIIATEDGTISGWQRSAGGSFVLRVDNSASGAVYKGLASASVDGALRLFAADFHNNRIDVFDDTYKQLNIKGDFRDRELDAGFAPFNITAAGGALIVTYALQDADAHDDVKGPGNGFVDLFSTEGQLVSRLVSHDGLNSPWGVAIAPLDFGRLSNRLLVGNFGDGHINAYRLDGDEDDESLTAEHEGVLRDMNGHALSIDGLWAIRLGVGTGGFDSHAIYFTAGPVGESHGLFGRLDMIEQRHHR